MKRLIGIFILLLCINTVSAIDYYNNTTNIISGICPEIIGGTNVVTLHPHYVDGWFSVYNDGGVSYMVYAYNYIGLHDPSYKNAFIGTIEPGQMGVLNNNASYYIYADYNGLRDLGDPDIVIDKIQTWWYVIIYMLLFIVTVMAVWKVIRK
jgi:hypothetical protein